MRSGSQVSRLSIAFSVIQDTRLGLLAGRRNGLVATLVRMTATLDAVRLLAADPEVAAEVDQARAACTELRWHNALRRRIPQAAAESRVRGARASAALEGAEVSVDVVRELVVGLTAWPERPDPLERSLRAAVQATAESENIRSLILSSPAQALARLHVAAGAGLVDDGAVGRPRAQGEGCAELADVGEAPPAHDLPGRLAGLYELVACANEAPVAVVAALVHAEIAVMRPFVRGNGVVARAFERALVQSAGLDPTGVAVAEHGYLREATAGYVGALAAYASGSPQGVALWLRFSAGAVQSGAREGVRIADAVLAGRLR